MKAKYINPYTDFGFKKLFGEEGSKDLLIDFLNQLLPAYHQIANLTFRNSESTAELANLTVGQRDSYEQSLIQYRDMKSVLETAVEDKLIEIAKNGIDKGYSNEVLVDLTGLLFEEIERLRQNRKR